jgi:hypothetical protein
MAKYGYRWLILNTCPAINISYNIPLATSKREALVNTVSDIVEVVNWIEKNPVVGTAILGSVGYTIVGASRSILRKLSKSPVHIKPTFWTLGKKFRIDAVHKYVPPDNASGYKQIQHSRPDQWNKLIEVKSMFNFRHTVTPIDKDDVLAVCISRDGTENAKVIYFNK